MSEAKFTPGPWKVNNILKSVESDRPHDAPNPWLNDYDFSVAVTVDGDEQLRDANGALIAAAPEMYKVLEHCLDYMTGGPFLTTQPTVEEVAGVLARARGEVQ